MRTDGDRSSCWRSRSAGTKSFVGILRKGKEVGVFEG